MTKSLQAQAERQREIVSGVMRDFKEAQLVKEIMHNSATVLTCVATAIRYPSISLGDLVRARASLNEAIAAATELDRLGMESFDALSEKIDAEARCGGNF